MSILQKIAEERIQEAMQRGEFDNLPGAGKPLQIEDLSMVPAELRMAYKVLKNGGCLPPELELHKEIRSVADMLGELGPGEERMQAIRRLEYLSARLSLTRRQEVSLQIEAGYYEKLMQRVSAEPNQA
ncbi:DnaJ family domain-containing protein [Thermithiobacillus plumbiphilus]|uniref:DnaJ family domain-containing protein n=1 Tax=Thermithiobacillus plumbiphilus TaxID=1729899 RepID=A0ABU9DB68_9PROT